MAVKVSLFATCLVDMFFPEVGMDAVEVLERLGCEVDFPEGQTCCGQPAYNCGHSDEARTLAVNYLNTFRSSEYIVAPSGSCAAMVREHYPDLFADDPELKRQAEEIAKRTYEFSEFLVRVLNVRDVGAAFPATVAYHTSCHMQRQIKVQQEPFQLLRKVKGLELKELDRPDLCCGFGGTFAVRNPEVSANMGDDKLDDAIRQGAEVLVGCDMACLMHLAGRNRRREGGLKLMHLAQILNRREAE